MITVRVSLMNDPAARSTQLLPAMLLFRQPEHGAQGQGCPPVTRDRKRLHSHGQKSTQELDTGVSTKSKTGRQFTLLTQKTSEDSHDESGLKMRVEDTSDLYALIQKRSEVGEKRKF